MINNSHRNYIASPIFNKRNFLIKGNSNFNLHLYPVSYRNNIQTSRNRNDPNSISEMKKRVLQMQSKLCTFDSEYFDNNSQSKVHRNTSRSKHKQIEKTPKQLYEEMKEELEQMKNELNTEKKNNETLSKKLKGILKKENISNDLIQMNNDLNFDKERLMIKYKQSEQVRNQQDILIKELQKRVFSLRKVFHEQSSLPFDKEALDFMFPD